MKKVQIYWLQLVHGSGKTAVLVERIINKVVNQNIDIDKILVVTFTNAAAAEMRERILDAIYKKLEEDPNNTNLQRQILLLNKSSICTIHSFCLDVIRNNFYEIDINPNFKIAETTEIEILKEEVLEEIFEKKYIENNKEFINLINTYTSYRGDEKLKEIILNIYKFIQSSPFPEKWLTEKVELFNLKDKLEEDFSNTYWGEILLEKVELEITDYIMQLQLLKNKLAQFSELEKYTEVVNEDIEEFENIIKNINSWDNTYELVSNLKYARLPNKSKDISNILIEETKNTIDDIKKNFNKIKENVLIYKSSDANSDCYEMYKILKDLKDLILEFSKEFSDTKKERGIVDFNDIEHYALKILLNDENISTDVAKNYQEKFAEILIDEYQDSNLVQEYILTSVSKQNNTFMVGDIKQSIYKFRQAMPELFLNKYETYTDVGISPVGVACHATLSPQNTKIKLFKNFRSKQNVLDVVNLIFENIMSKALGDIQYNKEEYLNLGAEYSDSSTEGNLLGNAELHIIDMNREDKDIEYDENANISEENDEQEEQLDNIEVEAKFVANKIKEMLKNNYLVKDKKQGYRKLTYKDIVILLRTTSNNAEIFKEALTKENFPVFSDTGSKYLESIEIQTIMCLLKVVDNPNIDIPLISILRSPIVGFTDNDLVKIRLYDKQATFYESLLKAKEDEELGEKIEQFLDKLDKWKAKSEYLALDMFIWELFLDTGYYSYVSLMPEGIKRQANLKMLFERAKQYEKTSFKGLFNFILFIERLNVSNKDMDSAKLIGENQDVIRIMSIHKSKGLEFPVVFLCGTGKNFNMQDLNQNILFHQDIGIGPEYINYERKITYNTLAKQAIKYKTKTELLAEEMRVLYVALTRAKEKLIITGFCKDLQKSLKSKNDLIDRYTVESENEKINKMLLLNAKSYLDWLMLVSSYNNKEKIKEIIDVCYHKKDEILTEQSTLNIQIGADNILKKLNEDIELNTQAFYEIEKALNWGYEHINATKMKSKMSVTDIVGANDISDKEKQTVLIEKPKFLLDKLKLSNAEIGTVVHYILQNLDLKNIEYTEEKIKELVNNMVAKEKITQSQADAINLENIYNFTQSNLANRIRKSKKLYNETGFYTNMQIEEESIVVQGIIDCYFEEDDGNIVLLDYKTDYVKSDENELIEKYIKQLELYKKALEESLSKEIKEVYIYSTYLNKEICLQIM